MLRLALTGAVVDCEIAGSVEVVMIAPQPLKALDLLRK